jgi:hypothetical protein
MKIKFILWVALFGITLVACNISNDHRKSFGDVTEYNDFLVDHIETINAVYTYTLDTSLTAEVALKACDSLVELCDYTSSELKNIQPFQGDSSFTMQTLAYVQYMKHAGQKDLKEFLSLEEVYFKGEYGNETDIVAEIEDAIGKINQRQELESEKVDLVQKKFAEKYHMTVLNQ